MYELLVETNRPIPPSINFFYTDFCHLSNSTAWQFTSTLCINGAQTSSDITHGSVNHF